MGTRLQKIIFYKKELVNTGIIFLIKFETLPAHNQNSSLSSAINPNRDIILISSSYKLRDIDFYENSKLF